jgi:exopolyphosphatase/guanosine-5'-triphosphate,3'-diphosphate pyrophosphatase
MFSIADPAEAGSLRWQPRKRILELTLTQRGKALFGEVAQARFSSLALSMKATTKVLDA